MGQQVYSENSRFNIPWRKFIMSVKGGEIEVG
jgi:hypothetical protein